MVNSVRIAVFSVFCASLAACRRWGIDRRARRGDVSWVWGRVLWGNVCGD